MVDFFASPLTNDLVLVKYILNLYRRKPMTIKERAIELIRSLPGDCTIEDIQYHLYVYEKVERGMGAIDAGKVVPQEEAEKKIKKWLER